MPYKTEPSITIENIAVAKLRLFNSFNSTIGCGCLHSHQTHTIKMIDAMMVPPRTQCDANQSSSCPLSSTICSVPTPRATSPSPV